MSAINGSKSNTSSSKSSTEGGPAPQRFDVAAMVLLVGAVAAAEAVAGARERGGMCTRGGSECGLCASASRRRSLARSRGGGRLECGALAVSPAAAALARQSCRVAEAEHRNDSCASKCSDGSCVRP